VQDGANKKVNIPNSKKIMKTKLAVMVVVSLMGINGAFACFHSILVSCAFSPTPAEPDPHCVGGYCSNCSETAGDYLRASYDELPGYMNVTENYPAWCVVTVNCLDCWNQPEAFDASYYARGQYVG
jgi:hypothetical protein